MALRHEMLRSVVRVCLTATIGASPLWFAGCENKEKLIDIETPAGEVEVERDKDTGEVDVELDKR